MNHLLRRPAYTDFQRYLAAKKSVDDRALNHHVWNTLSHRLQGPELSSMPPRIVEIGAGIGTMVERMMNSGLLTKATYTLVDELAANLVEARARLPRWAEQAGLTVLEPAIDGRPCQLVYPGAPPAHSVALTLDFVVADCFDYAAQPAEQGQVDLLIAHALLDLFDVPQALSKLRTLLKPGGLLYATINFDGNTILQPEIDGRLDAQIEAAYHATMDNRMTNGLPSGDSHTGRHLFHNLREAGFTILDAGSSDWVVFGDGTGYPADEAYFLHFIVNTMAGALQDEPSLDQAQFAQWIEKRHAQIERGELVYIAHQLDFLARY